MTSYYKDKEIFGHGKDCYGSKLKEGFNTFMWSTKEVSSHAAHAYAEMHKKAKWVSPGNAGKAQLERQFNELAEKWKKETAAYSTTLHITRNDNYLDIIGLGKDAVPLILKDLQKASEHWFVALKAITKENPVPKEHFGNIKKMRQDWLEWGKRKNLL